MPARGAAGVVAAPRQRLSGRLRERTRAAHAATEALVAVETRVASRAAYASLLLALRPVYGPVERSLLAVPGWGALTPAVDVAGRARAHLLDRDLARLGVDPPSYEPRLPEAPRPATLAEGLGCLYVLEGSALGGQLVAARARDALGDDLPVAFLTSAGRPGLGRDWRALQAALDTLPALDALDAGPRGEDEGGTEVQVVSAALDTFAALGVALARGTNPGRR